MSTHCCLHDVNSKRIIKGLEGLLRGKGQDIIIQAADISPGCPNGENFVGQILRVSVRGRTRKDARGYAECFILKMIPPPGSVNHKFFNCRAMFENEITGYEVVLRGLDRFANREKSPKTTCFVEYHGSAYDFIALEDFKPKGYRMGDRVRGFNVKECLLVIEKLSDFHATSLAMKSADYGMYRDTVSRLRETVFNEEMSNGVVRLYWENAVKFALKSLNGRRDPELGKAVDLLTSYQDSVFSGMMSIIRPEEPYDVICHGDLWTNNILVRYTDGEADDVRMVDLQAMRHGSCVLDVMHLLFTSLANGLLQSHFLDVLSFYYGNLVRRMRCFGTEPVFTFEELRKEFRTKVRYGLCVACLMFTFVTKEASEGSDVVPTTNELSSDDTIEGEYRSLNALYHERLYDLVTALISLDLI